MKRAMVVVVGALVAGCAPSPDVIRVETRSESSAIETEDVEALATGDLRLLVTTPRDQGGRMDLCVDATSSDTSVVRVLRVKGECRQFVAIGEGAGTATVRFEARGTARAIRFDVARSGAQ